jgi:pentatricopeptide repeat protein
MMRQAGIRRFLSVAFFASALPVASQETKPSAKAQSASTQNEPAAVFKEAGDDFRKGSFDQAIAKYNEALKSDTQSAEAYTGIVRCYLRQDKVRDAAETLEKGLHAKPSDSGLKVAQGELLFRQGKISEAEKIFVEMINSGQAPARAFLGLAQVLEFGSLRQTNEDMVAFDLSNISRDVGTEVSGTLGFALLNLLKLKLDYRDALVKFECVPNPWMR